MPNSNAQVDADLDAALEAGTVWVGWSRNVPTNAAGSGFLEPTDPAYARVRLDPGDWAPASGGSKETGVDVAFPPASRVQGTAVAYGFFTAASGGSPRRWQRTAQGYNVAAGGVLTFHAGAITARGRL